MRIFYAVCVADLTFSELTAPVQYFWSEWGVVRQLFSTTDAIANMFPMHEGRLYSVPLGTVNIIFIMLELQALSSQWSCSQLVWGSPNQKGIAAPVWAHFSLSVAYADFQLFLCSFGELMGFIGNIYLKRKCLSQCLVEWLESLVHTKRVNTHLPNYCSAYMIILSSTVIQEN